EFRLWALHDRALPASSASAQHTAGARQSRDARRAHLRHVRAPQPARRGCWYSAGAISAVRLLSQQRQFQRAASASGNSGIIQPDLYQLGGYQQRPDRPAADVRAVEARCQREIPLANAGESAILGFTNRAISSIGRALL